MDINYVWLHELKQKKTYKLLFTYRDTKAEVNLSSVGRKQCSGRRCMVMRVMVIHRRGWNGNDKITLLLSSTRRYGSWTALTENRPNHFFYVKNYKTQNKTLHLKHFIRRRVPRGQRPGGTAVMKVGNFQ